MTVTGQMTTRVAPERLRSSRDIRAVFDARRSAGGRCVIVYALAAPEDDDDGPLASRVAVVAGRRVGSAVARNRAKRRLRACARLDGVPPAMDLVLVARTSALEADFAALRDDVRQCLVRAARKATQA